MSQLQFRKVPGWAWSGVREMPWGTMLSGGTARPPEVCREQEHSMIGSCNSSFSASLFCSFSSWEGTGAAGGGVSPRAGQHLLLPHLSPAKEMGCLKYSLGENIHLGIGTPQLASLLPVRSVHKPYASKTEDLAKQGTEHQASTFG